MNELEMLYLILLPRDCIHTTRLLSFEEVFIIVLNTFLVIRKDCVALSL